jgi:hypothetical protein
MKKNPRKSEKKVPLEERIEALEKEIDAELDRMAEEVRPKDERGAPTPTAGPVVSAIASRVRSLLTCWNSGTRP